MKIKFLNIVSMVHSTIKTLFNLNNDVILINSGDYVKVIDCEHDLSFPQQKFLKSKDYFVVENVEFKSGEYYIHIGYTIPFKMKRFVKYELKYDKRILFLQFNLNITTHGEVDTENIFRGCETMQALFPKLLNEKRTDTLVEFSNYADIFRMGNNYYVNNIDIKDYDFVFFGFAKKFSNIPYYIQKYLKKNNIPYLTYESYNLYDDKIYGLDIVNELGYHYIPTIQTTKLNNTIKDYVKENFGYPLIAKITDLDQGKGVYKLNDEQELITFYNCTSNNRVTFIQKLIPNDGDCRVILIKNKVKMVVKRQMTSETEFRSNVALGGKAMKASLPQHILDMCEDISKHIECDIIGFDILQNKETGEFYVMEINVSPHMSTFSLVTGIDLTGIISDYILNNLKKIEVKPILKSEEIEEELIGIA